jgi:hypothetical protein
MIPLKSNINVDNSDPSNYPDGRVKDNTGTGNGTPVDRNVYGDLHSNISRLMREYGIVPSGLPDNETNGYQIIQALSALASKNDFIYALTTSAGVLNIDIKLSNMKTNEFLICRASADKTTETAIKGIGATTFAVLYSGSFKANEYVRLIKTVAGVSIVRIADWESLNAMVADFSYLKKASQAQEDAGAVDTVATTPLVNKVAFAKRVTGIDSATYLASASNNGLMSAAQFLQLAGLSGVRNRGWFSGLDVGASGSLPVSGYTSAVSTGTGGVDDESFVLVTMPVAMDNLNYRVECFIESEGTLGNDNEIGGIVFQPVTTTTFNVSIRGLNVITNSLKVHMDVRQLL